ncbi:MAG: hypothetical protein ACPLXC_01450 [Candidatus Pacearchaeota archaeon]
MVALILFILSNSLILSQDSLEITEETEISVYLNSKDNIYVANATLNITNKSLTVKEQGYIKIIYYEKSDKKKEKPRVLIYRDMKENAFFNFDEQGELIGADFYSAGEANYAFKNTLQFNVPPETHILYTKGLVKIECPIGLEGCNLTFYDRIVSIKNFLEIENNKLIGNFDHFSKTLPPIKVFRTKGGVVLTPFGMQIVKDSSVNINGMLFNNQIKGTNVYFDDSFDPIKHKNENYFSFGKDKFWMGGDGLEVRPGDGNPFFDIWAKDKASSEIVQFMLRDLSFQVNGGHLKVGMVSEEPLSLHIKSEGSYYVLNGNTLLKSDGRKLYAQVKPPPPNFLTVATDTRIELLAENKPKIYDMNVRQDYTRDLSESDKEKLQKELTELKELKSKIEAINFDVEGNPIDTEEKEHTIEFIESEIFSREKALEENYVRTMPLFGEVIKKGSVEISASEFFNAPLLPQDTKAFVAQSGNDAVVLLASTYGYEKAFENAVRVRAEELQNTDYYILLMTDVIKDYPSFFEMLKAPALPRPEMKIKRIEMFSHAWKTGTWLDTQPEINNKLEKIVPFEYFAKYISPGGLRNVVFQALTEEEKEMIRKSFTPETEISFRGCNTAFPDPEVKPMACTVYETFKTKVEASPVGTDVIWKNPQGEFIVCGLAKGEIYCKNRKLSEKDLAAGTVFFTPSPYYLKYIKGIFPEINGYIKIVGMRRESGKTIFEVEYPTKGGIKKTELTYPE